MKLPPKERIVASRLEKYPPPPENENASVKYWRSFSPYWWGVVQGLIEGLLQKILWDDLTDEIRQQIEVLALPEEPECEDCPPTAPQTTVPSGGYGGIGYGITGLSIEELEEFYLMYSLRGQLKIISGKLHYYDPGCCEWVAVETEAGSTDLSAETIQKISTGLLTAGEWEQLGEPSVPTLPTPQHSNPSYNTEDSIKCAKATALVNQLRDNHMDVFQAFVAAGGGVGFTTSVVVGALITALSIPAALALVIATVIVAAAAIFGWGTILNTLEDTAEDDSAWADMLCNMVKEMTAGESIQAVDVATMFYWYRDSHGITLDDWLYKTFHSFSIQYWQTNVQPKVSDAECDCEQYLPYGYIPPSSAGAINFLELVNCGSSNSSNDWNYIVGLPYEGMMFSPDQGQVLGANSWRTTYTGADTDGGEPNKYTKLSMLFDMPPLTRIDQIKFDVALTGAPTGAGDVNLNVQQVILNTSGVWQENTGQTFTPLQSGVDRVYDCSDVRGSKMAIMWVTRNENINLYATISNIRFTGDADGAGFLDVPLGQPLP